MNKQHFKQKRLESYRWLPKSEFSKYSQQDKAAIINSIREFAKATYAERRANHLRAQARMMYQLPDSAKPVVVVLIAVIGALIASAAVQSITLTLPQWLSYAATPFIAAVFVYFTELLTENAMTVMHFKLVHLMEKHRLENLSERVSSDQYPLNEVWLEAQQEQHDETEDGRPWPVLVWFVVIPVFLLEAGSAFIWLRDDDPLLRLVAAAAPPVYVFLAALSLSYLTKGAKNLVILAQRYEELIPPQTLAPEYGLIPTPSYVQLYETAHSNRTDSPNGEIRDQVVTDVNQRPDSDLGDDFRVTY